MQVVGAHHNISKGPHDEENLLEVAIDDDEDVPVAVLETDGWKDWEEIQFSVLFALYCRH